MHPKEFFFWQKLCASYYIQSHLTPFFEIISHPCCLVVNVSNHELLCHVAYALNTLFKVQVSNPLDGLLCHFMISYLSKMLLCHLVFTRERYILVFHVW